MAQAQKPHVREAILRAAAEQLAQSGYEGMTLANVAERAGTSIGNLYKYFSNKEALFDATIPPELVREAESLLFGRISALGAEREIEALDKDHPYHLASEALLRFSIANRHALLFLLRRAGQTRHAAFADDLTAGLVRRAVAYAEGAYPNSAFPAARRRALTRIYRAFLLEIALILEEETSARALSEAAFWLSQYHLTGLRAFFETNPNVTPEIST